MILSTFSSPSSHCSCSSFFVRFLPLLRAWFSITYFDNGGGDAVTNFPLFVELSEGQYESVNDLPIRAMFIKPIDGSGVRRR